MNRLYFVSILFALATKVMAQDAHVHDTGAAPQDARDAHAHATAPTQESGPVSPNAQGLMSAGPHQLSTLLADRVEYHPDARTGTYHIQAWRGSSFNRLVIKSEGELAEDDHYENTTELLWGHAVSPFWDSQFGVRIDSGSVGKNRQWLAAGLQGLAPYWFEVDATAYIGHAGQSELVFDAQYELLLTQRLILQPRAEFTLRGKDDLENLLGSGLSKASFGLRLRYEFTRQFAPYIGLARETHFGATAQLIRRAGEPSKDTRYFLGLRFWF